LRSGADRDDPRAKIKGRKRDQFKPADGSMRS
jgi:hypothetical protein